MITRILNYLLLFIVAVVGITFAYQNAHTVVFNYYFAEKSLPLSLLLTLSLGLGLLLGFLVTLFSWLKLKHKNIKLKKRLKNTIQELENLRNIPLKKENIC